MRYVSLFSGIEAATVAWEPLGWEPVAFCEIDEFPSAVLRARYPNVPNLGDITAVDWTAFKEEHGAVDIVVGGSPCQSFSVAGKREGLAGASGLMWEYVRAIQNLMPEWLVWENVPGALSVERGWAFEQLLSSLDGIGYGLAWRVLDAQFFGVAQRRRRVFLVGHIGDMRASEVLFESESMCWGSPSSREKRQALARSAGRGAVPGRGDGCLNPWDVQSKRIFAADSCGMTLNSGTNEGMNIQPSVLQPMAFKYSAGAAAQTMPCYDDGSVNTLTADTHPPAAAHAVTQYGDDMARTLCASGGSPTPAPGERKPVRERREGDRVQDDTCDSRAVTIHDGTRWVVRRLTPIECERLQGFPDGWTDIGDWVDSKGKTRKTTDGNRYKALGNSFAVPVVRWIGERIEIMRDE